MTQHFDPAPTYPNGNLPECLERILECLGSEATKDDAKRMLAALKQRGFDWESQHLKETDTYWEETMATAFPSN